MLALLAFARAEILWIVVALSLVSGLIGAYGRERHEGRRPDGAWWITRLCIMPFLAIVVAFCIDQFTLTRQQAALLSALLALMGYEAVRIILEKAARRGGAFVDAVVATPKPYASLIDTDEAGRPTAHVVMTPGEGKPTQVIGGALQDAYAKTVNQPLDPDMTGLLDKLGGTDSGNGNHGEDSPLQ